MRNTFGSRIAELWCRLMHPAVMWPVRGYYRCATCLREYPVAWEHSRLSLASRSSDAPPIGKALVQLAQSR